jgi:hypothetical protein
MPTENARSTAAIAGAVVSDLLPIGSNTVNELWQQTLRRRYEAGQQILIEEVRKKGIEALADEQLNYFVPASYRFFENVRLGTCEHALKFLASFMANELSKEYSEVPKTSKVADAVSGLDEIDIQLFHDAYKSECINRAGEEGLPCTSAKKIMELFPARYENTNETVLTSSLSYLASKNLLFQMGPVTIDDQLPFYRVSRLGWELVGAAADILRTESD